MRRVPALLLAVLTATAVAASAPSVSAAASEDSYSGSDMWLHYVPVSDPDLLAKYRASATTIVVENAERNEVYRHTEDLRMEAGARERLVATSLEAARDELARGLRGLLGQAVPVKTSPTLADGSVIVGTRESSKLVRQHISADELAAVGDEGYVIRSVSSATIIAAKTEIGALYGTFAFLRRMQTQKPITELDIADSPRIENRHLNNWERTRLYAGNDASGTGGRGGENGTIFNFAATGASAERNLPVILDRYIVVARALASLGINGFEINLVNADNVYLTSAYIAQ